MTAVDCVCGAQLGQHLSCYQEHLVWNGFSLAKHSCMANSREYVCIVGLCWKQGLAVVLNRIKG